MSESAAKRGIKVQDTQLESYRRNMAGLETRLTICRSQPTSLGNTVSWTSGRAVNASKSIAGLCLGVNLGLRSSTTTAGATTDYLQSPTSRGICLGITIICSKTNSTCDHTPGRVCGRRRFRSAPCRCRRKRCGHAFSGTWLDGVDLGSSSSWFVTSRDLGRRGRHDLWCEMRVGRSAPGALEDH